jgi:hypothetical protein
MAVPSPPSDLFDPADLADVIDSLRQPGRRTDCHCLGAVRSRGGRDDGCSHRDHDKEFTHASSP